MAFEAVDAARHTLLLVLALLGLLFASRALTILRRPPLGETGRELVFLAARDLLLPMSLVGIIVALEVVQWVVQAVNDLSLASVPRVSFVIDVTQALLLLVAGFLGYRTLAPYTRTRRSQHASITLDRLAARVSLLRGRR